MQRFSSALIALVLCCGIASAAPNASPGKDDLMMPRYDHIFVIMEENKDYGQIVGSEDAPTITRLAHEYGIATQFFAETHPSEPNYVALIGGYTYGIRDDDAYYCKPRDTRAFCSHSGNASYANHTVDGPSLATQLQAAGLSWKNYNESLPAPGSLAVIAADRTAKDVPPTMPVYASKHSGFVNFKSVQESPQRADQLVGFDQLHADLKGGKVPNFSLIVPNLCDEMHGAGDADAPEDCQYKHFGKLIWRGDRTVEQLVGEIEASPVWKSSGNAAIVVTFDEDDRYSKAGCCGNSATDPANAGGGHIATVVITNHGRHGVSDPTPYSHYSLLRTIEDAFGIHSYLRQAGAQGVHPMLPLFSVKESAGT